MILLIYFILLFIVLRKTKSISLLLIGILIFSLIGANLINRTFDISSWHEVFNLFFLGLILTLFILPWKNFKSSTNIIYNLSKKQERRLDNISRFLIITCGISTAILTFGFIYTYSAISDYEAFKNGEEGYNFIKNTLPINSTVYFLSQYFSAGSYFLLPFHFYYMQKGLKMKSVLCILFSLSLVLSGLVIFSRSSIVLFLVLYSFYFILFYNTLSDKAVRKIKQITTISAIVIGVFFLAITLNRFGEKDGSSGYQGIGGTIEKQGFVTNPVLYSLLDYPCQWYENGSEIMSEYNLETKEYITIFPLGVIILDKLGVTNNYIEKQRIEAEKLLPMHHFLFNGLVALLLYDYGYLGTLLFVLLYCFILRKFKPKNGILNFSNTLFLGILYTLPAMAIFGFWLNNPFYNFAIVYGVVFYIYIFKK